MSSTLRILDDALMLIKTDGCSFDVVADLVERHDAACHAIHYFAV
jgi:hypothetical protein